MSLPIYLDHNASTPVLPRVREVLLAMGIPSEDALGAVRLSLGRLTTGEAIDRAAALFLAAARA